MNLKVFTLPPAKWSVLILYNEFNDNAGIPFLSQPQKNVISLHLAYGYNISTFEQKLRIDSNHEKFSIIKQFGSLRRPYL